MNLRDLSYAVAVADLRHFGRAATRCHVSQPALSGQIKKLEDGLGVALFERSNRRVAVTPAGTKILAYAREILRLSSLIEETARSQADPLAGPLRLGVIPTIAPYLAPTLLPALRDRMPRLELRLVEDLTTALEEALVKAELDAAIIATPPEDPALEDMPLYHEPFWVALPRDHPLAEKDEVSIPDIDSKELLLLADGHCLRDEILKICAHRPAASDLTVNTQNTSLTTILALVGAGAGLTLVPATSLRGSWMTDAGVVLRPEPTGTAKRTVRLVFRKTYPRQAVLTALADGVRLVLPNTVTPC